MGETPLSGSGVGSDSRVDEGWSPSRPARAERAPAEVAAVRRAAADAAAVQQRDTTQGPSRDMPLHGFEPVNDTRRGGSKFRKEPDLLTWLFRRSRGAGIGLVATGFALLALGVAGDLNGWWDELGFTSNVLAGLTGACFGIPVAYFVIQVLLRQEDERYSRSRVVRAARQNLIEMVETLDGHFGAEHADDAVSVADAAFETLLALHENATRLPQIPDRVVVDAQDAIGKLYGQAALDAISAGASLSEWKRIRLRWQSLSTSLIPEARALGIEVLPAQAEGYVESCMAAEKPLTVITRYGWGSMTVLRDLLLELGARPDDSSPTVWTLSPEVEAVGRSIMSEVDRVMKVRQNYANLRTLTILLKQAVDRMNEPS